MIKNVLLVDDDHERRIGAIVSRGQPASAQEPDAHCRQVAGRRGGVECARTLVA